MAAGPCLRLKEGPLEVGQLEWVSSEHEGSLRAAMVPSHHKFLVCRSNPTPPAFPTRPTAVPLLFQNDFLSATFSPSLGPCNYFHCFSQICFPFSSLPPTTKYALGTSPSISICICSGLPLPSELAQHRLVPRVRW